MNKNDKFTIEDLDRLIKEDRKAQQAFRGTWQSYDMLSDFMNEIIDKKMRELIELNEKSNQIADVIKKMTL